MASATGYFNPVDLLTINTLLTLTGDYVWLIQSNNRSSSKELAKGLNGVGDVSKSKLHNLKQSRTLVYECQAESGTLKIPVIGTVTADGYHIDSAKVDYANAGWPKLTVIVHKHMGAASHAANSCRTYTSTLALPACFGIPSVLNDLTPEHPTEPVTHPVPMFELDNADTALRSLSYGISVTHLDEPDGAGNWHSGENRAGLETIDATFLGVPEDADVTIGTGWNDPSDGENATNQASDSRTLSLQHDLALDAA